MDKESGSSLSLGRGEKRPLAEQDSMKLLTTLTRVPSPPPADLTTDSEEEEDGLAITENPSPPLESFQQVRNIIQIENEGTGAINGEIHSVQDLKRVLEIEQKTALKADEGKETISDEHPQENGGEKDVDTKRASSSSSSSGATAMKRQEAEPGEKEVEEKSNEPTAADPIATEAAKASAAYPSNPSLAATNSVASTTRIARLERSSSGAGDDKDLTIIFKSAPVIQNIEIEYSVDSFKVGHFNFVIDMMYDEHTWKVMCHRQTLLEFHTTLKSIRLQNQLSWFNPFRFCRSTQDEDLLESVAETVEPGTVMQRGVSSRKLLNKKETVEEAIKDIHFPRPLLMGDRPHFFHRGRNLTEFNQYTEETLKQVKSSVHEYLNRVLASRPIRNLQCTLDLLRCSVLSFDKSLGPSVIEGWVTFQKHSPSKTSIRWHTCRSGCIVCNCAVVPISNSKRYRAWIVVKGSFAVFLRKPLESKPLHVLLFDSGFDILKGFTTTGRKKHIYLQTNTSVADLTFASRNEKKVWAHYLRIETTATSWHCKDHPHRSFAPEREDRCFAKFLVDGESYFEAVANGLENAKSEIFISGWWVTPDVILKRKAPEGNEYWKLSSILKRKAQQGVKVYVFMYKEVEVAIALQSRFQESRLKGENIYVLRHPNFTLGGSWYWSHHEKLVVCDSVVAFAGGLDLCWGRYDNASHSLMDNPLENLWPGIDYYNPRIQDIPDPRLVDNDILDRDADPRMPWHDVSCHVSGPVARDIARHFVHQWNFAIISKSGSRYDLPLLIPHDFPSYPDPEPDQVKVKTQVLRSLPQWSGGPENNDEMSIQEAYISAISDAQKYVYIENQFFVSGLQGDGLIQNRIADALYARISRAAAEKKNFKVMVFLPLLPAFEGAVDDSGQAALRQVLFWQYRTICRGENRRSLWQMLEDNPDVQDPGDYISFFGLRTFDKNQVSAIDESPKVLTEMVYIHSKCMIVDDHVAFIGSANINDRSMTGARDSELCIKFMDVTFNKDAKLGGEAWRQSGVFAKGLRMRLFEEHFGQYLPTEVLDDFVLSENFEQLKGLARSNTECFEKVFSLIPSDNILTFGDLKRIGNRGSRPPEPTGPGAEAEAEEEDEDFNGSEISSDAGSVKLKRLQSFSSLDKSAPGVTFREKIAYLNGVYGHVVQFPMRFLSRARKLKPAGGVLGDQIFT